MKFKQTADISIKTFGYLYGEISNLFVFENLSDTYITRGLRVTLVTLLRLVCQRNIFARLFLELNE